MRMHARTSILHVSTAEIQTRILAVRKQKHCWVRLTAASSWPVPGSESVLSSTYLHTILALSQKPPKLKSIRIRGTTSNSGKKKPMATELAMFQWQALSFSRGSKWPVTTLLVVTLSCPVAWLCGEAVLCITAGYRCAETLLSTGRADEASLCVAPCPSAKTNK